VIVRAAVLAVGLVAALVDCRPQPAACPVTQKLMRASYPHPMTCAPDPSAVPCISCLRSACCAEARACDADAEPCGYVVRFYLEDGKVKTEERWKPVGGASDAMNACRTAHCAAACSLE
jgi:hypothetical protein